MEYKITIINQLSSLLLNLRKQAGITQQQLGERLGISQRMVSKIEANPTKVSFERIMQIFNELNTDLVVRERNHQPTKDRLAGGESW
jgi:HTH-type transcriptional regulator/antitoxin HipB